MAQTMLRRKFMGNLLTVLTAVGLACSSLLAQDPILIKIAEDDPALEFVGQFINDSSGSHQYGYLSRIQDLSPIFSGTPEDENTAMFTFCTEATTLQVRATGQLRVINRVGTTTIFFTETPSPRNPVDRSTFCSGTPIQVSAYRQQVVNNLLTGSFTTVHVNTITSLSPFELHGSQYQLGQLGKSYRTNYTGHVNASPPPSGWFGGYAVGMK
jgi:hypothetical protein